MASPKQDDLLTEYDFTISESITARILSEVQIMWLKSKYAQLFKEKASKFAPEEMTLDRSYIMAICELDGKLNLIEEILLDHRQAVKDLQDLSAKQSIDPNAGAQSIDEISKRASELVNKS